VAFSVIARSTILYLILAGIFTSFGLSAADDLPVTKGSPESREEEARIGFKHVQKIHAPERTITGDSPGRSDKGAHGAIVVVIGSIEDHSVREILTKVREQLGERANRETRVTGDERYAIVKLGNREKDPCCFSEFLFANHEAKWVLLHDIWISH
jgi:hypothetical protein